MCFCAAGFAVYNVQLWTDCPVSIVLMLDRAVTGVIINEPQHNTDNDYSTHLHTHTHRQRERERETQHSGHIPYYNSITHFELHMCVRCCAVSQCIIWYTQDMNLTFYRKTITIVRLVVVADVDHLHRVPLLASSANALPRHITHIMAYLSLIMYMILMSHTTHITPFLHRFWSTLRRQCVRGRPWLFHLGACAYPSPASLVVMVALEMNTGDK